MKRQAWARVIVLGSLVLGASIIGAPYRAGAQESPAALFGVYMDSPQTGWVVGRRGVILNTTNGGKSWIVQSSGVRSDLRMLLFLDLRVGWAVGDAGVILSSTSNGALWNRRLSDTEAGLRSVYFLPNGPKDGYVVGENGTILISHDSGHTWESKPSGVTTRLNDVFFLDAATGWAVGDGGVIVTTVDRGGHWTPVSSPTPVNLNSVLFTSTDGWIVGDGGTVLHSPAVPGDRLGTTWTAQTLEAGRLFDIYFLPKSATGWILGEKSVLFKTTDKGLNWEAGGVYGPAGSGIANAVAFAAGDGEDVFGWAVTTTGSILFSNDGGGSWKEQFRYRPK